MEGRRHRRGEAAGERSHDHTTRLLALLRLLHQRGSLTRQALSAELGSLYGPHPDRTIRRDIAALAGRNVAELHEAPGEPSPHGFDIRHDRARDTFTLVTSDLLPRLTPEEQDTLQAICQALGNDPLLGRRLESLLAHLAAGEAPTTPPSVWLNLGLATDYTPHETTLLRLVQAAQGQRAVSFEYRSPRTNEGRLHRMVDVYPLELADGHYYVDGYHHEAGKFITYRVDRIVPGSLRILPGYGDRRQRARLPVTVTYWLSPQLASGGVSKRLLDQREEPSPDGGLIVTGKARSLFHVRRLLLGYGAHAEALEPPELRAELADDIRLMARRYGAGTEDEA
jgi:predicted DNA-binding transcriptional regulator YafY